MEEQDQGKASWLGFREWIHVEAASHDTVNDPLRCDKLLSNPADNDDSSNSTTRSYCSQSIYSRLYRPAASILVSHLDQSTTSSVGIANGSAIHIFTRKTGRSSLVKLVVKLSSSCRAKWIVSSRDWPEIKREFRGIQGLVPITLEENKKEVAEAVKSYIRIKVNELAEHWDDDGKNEKNDNKHKMMDLKGKVYDHMISHAGDTFLWVALVCQRLAESDVSKRRALEELKRFPRGLPALYNLMMDRILASSESDRLKSVLAAACVAYGHLKSDEMVGFVKSMAGYDETDVEETIGICGSFLTYQDGVISVSLGSCPSQSRPLPLSYQHWRGPFHLAT